MLWVVLMLFGLLTLGLGFPLLGVLPLVPFCYHCCSWPARQSPRPGSDDGLVVRRNDDLGRHPALQAADLDPRVLPDARHSGLLLLVALITDRQRTLHDLVTGLVVVRAERDRSH